MCCAPVIRPKPSNYGLNLKKAHVCYISALQSNLFFGFRSALYTDFEGVWNTAAVCARACRERREGGGEAGEEESGGGGERRHYCASALRTLQLVL